MRTVLKTLRHQRLTFTATFERYGHKSDYNGFPIKTLLFRNVKREGMEVCDHIWFTVTKSFEKIGPLQQGNLVQFDARVAEYVKGYVSRDEDNSRVDYRLSHPTKTQKL